MSDPWEVASRTFPLISPSSLSLPRQARPPLATTLTPRMSKSNYLNTAAASEQNGGECNEGGNPAIKIRLHEDLCILTPATWQLLSASFCVVLTTTAIQESFLPHQFQFDKKNLSWWSMKMILFELDSEAWAKLNHKWLARKCPSSFCGRCSRHFQSSVKTGCLCQMPISQVKEEAFFVIEHVMEELCYFYR